MTLRELIEALTSLVEDAMMVGGCNAKYEETRR